MHTINLRYFLLLLCLTTFVTAQSQVRDTTNRSRTTTKPPKDTTKSTFLNSLFNNLAADRKRRDSLDRYYHDHPARTEVYVRTQLVENSIVSTTDAIELVKAINPRIRNLQMVNFYTELRMPHFQKLKHPDKKRLKKERRSLLKYDSKTNNALATKLDACQNSMSRISSLKLQFYDNVSSSYFNNLLDQSYRQLQHYRNEKLKKGTTLFLIQQADLLNSIMNDVISSRRAGRGHIDAMNKLQGAISFSKPTMSNSNEVSYNDNYIAEKTSSSLWTNEVSSPQAFDLTSPGETENVLCYIYAMKSTPSGKEVDINGQYFFSYQPYGNATYNCRTGECAGFNETGRTVSVNGVNIVPSDYVFCFRDKTTNTVYYRCIDKTSFEQISNSGNRKKWKIVFNPETKECKEFFNW